MSISGLGIDGWEMIDLSDFGLEESNQSSKGAASEDSPVTEIVQRILNSEESKGAASEDRPIRGKELRTLIEKDLEKLPNFQNAESRYEQAARNYDEKQGGSLGDKEELVNLSNQVFSAYLSKMEELYALLPQELGNEAVNQEVGALKGGGSLEFPNLLFEDVKKKLSSKYQNEKKEHLKDVSQDRINLAKMQVMVASILLKVGEIFSKVGGKQEPEKVAVLSGKITNLQEGIEKVSARVDELLSSEAEASSYSLELKTITNLQVRRGERLLKEVEEYSRA